MVQITNLVQKVASRAAEDTRQLAAITGMSEVIGQDGTADREAFVTKLVQSSARGR
ncbi:hypothetical protein [Nostoc linckia]|uniref:hypothetical protein n=1 Tax=Nostoc linckia TaxID=92942 RepID=UPI0015D51EEB|nr:hypothetical protein [Nostoc linckia]